MAYQYTQEDEDRLAREIVNFVQYESYGDRSVRRDLKELERQLAIVRTSRAADAASGGRRVRVSYATFRRY